MYWAFIICVFFIVAMSVDMQVNAAVLFRSLYDCGFSSLHHCLQGRTLQLKPRCRDGLSGVLC